MIKERDRKFADPDHELVKWRRAAVLWPSACMVFAAVILYQAVAYHTVPGMAERGADVVFTLIPLVFFGIGMRMRRRILEERRYAVRMTNAVVVTEGRRTRPGHRSFYPEYEFQADGRTYHVVSRNGYGVCAVKTGKQVELYYAPEHPEIFYVPDMQRRDKRLSGLFCGIGVVLPLMGLLAPYIRNFFILRS